MLLPACPRMEVRGGVSEAERSSSRGRDKFEERLLNLFFSVNSVVKKTITRGLMYRHFQNSKMPVMTTYIKMKRILSNSFTLRG